MVKKKSKSKAVAGTAAGKQARLDATIQRMPDFIGRDDPALRAAMTAKPNAKKK